MAQRNLRLPDTLKERIEQVASERGYRSSSAFMIEAIQEKLRRDDTIESMSETEARIAASFNQIHRQLESLHTAGQGIFALTDALAKYVLTCMVEPPGELLASARARDRYDKLLRAAAKTITGETENPLMDTFMEDFDDPKEEEQEKETA
jgi:Arc/MetJ-type ribon-helix-helix transcriptional regulator